MDYFFLELTTPCKVIAWTYAILLPGILLSALVMAIYKAGE